MSALEPVAYSLDGELYCSQHGENLEQDVRDHCPDDEPCDECSSSVAGFYQWDNLSPVEWCSAGHSFCGSCGQETDESRKYGPFWSCSCGMTSVFTVENESVFVPSIEQATDTVTVTVPALSRYLGPETGDEPVGTVLDEWFSDEPMQTFACYRELSPVDGLVLVLAGSWEQAYEGACDHFLALDEPADEDEESDIRSDVQCVAVPLDRVRFSTVR